MRFFSLVNTLAALVLMERNLGAELFTPSTYYNLTPLGAELFADPDTELRNRQKLPDTVPYDQIISALEKCLKSTPPGSKLLVPDSIPTDKAINQLQQFILLHRENVQDPDSDRPLTFHGLRHTYAAEKYSQLIAEGVSELDAHLTVSRLLGHERADVTNIYLASVRKSNM